ncbi:ATP-binding cassette domain-containing protein, partial [bacterium]|nr:ATP-binding cassette domain-containing protein [bacterium]
INSLYLKISIDYILKLNNVKILFIITIFFSFFLLQKVFLSYLRENTINNIEKKFSSNLNFKVINHLFNLPYRYLNSKPSGELLSRINDLENIKQFINGLFINTFLDGTIFIMVLIILFIINKQMTLILFITLTIYSITILLSKRVFKNDINNLQINFSSYQTNLIENITGYETIKNLNDSENVIKKIDYKYNKYLRDYYGLKMNIFKESTINELIFGFYILIIFAYGTYQVINGKITVGDLASYFALSSLLIENVKGILEFLVNYLFHNNSYKRINELLLIKVKSEEKTLKKINGAIEIKKLGYTNSDNYLFKNINFRINEGDKCLIKGDSGSGKSTIMKIIRGYI